LATRNKRITIKRYVIFNSQDCNIPYDVSVLYPTEPVDLGPLIWVEKTSQF
jgi:hypothetical protein